MKRLLMIWLGILLSCSVACGDPIADESIGGILDVLEGGDVGYVLYGDGIGNAPSWGDLDLGSAASRDAEDTLTDGSNLPDGAAIKAYGDANWGGGGTGYWTQSGTDLYYNAGNVGIGTTTPSEGLEVAGTVYSTSGGFKFPDGTTQTTATGSPSFDSITTGTNTTAVMSVGTGATLSFAGGTINASHYMGVNSPTVMDFDNLSGTSSNLQLQIDTITGDLGTASSRDAEDTLTDGSNLPDGAAIKAYGDANWAGTGTGYWTQIGSDIYYNTGNVGVGTSSPTAGLHIDTSANIAFVAQKGGTWITAELKETESIGYAALGFYNEGTITGTLAVSGATADVLPGAFWMGARNNNDMHFTAGTSPNVTIKYAGNVGIGTITPNQKLTVEGAASLKEQAAANADTAAYGQIWVKNTTPNQLWFTDDAGTDVQLGVAGGGMVYPGAGIALSTGSAWDTSITNNSTNWDTAYTDRLKWDGGATGLVAATGRTSLELGTAATRDAEDTLTDGSNLPDGAAIKAYGDANWGGGGTGYWTQIGSDIYYNTGNVGIGTTSPGYELSFGNPTGKILALYEGASTQFYGLGIGTNQLEIFAQNSDQDPKIVVQAGGNVGIGTITPNQKLTVEGTASLKEQAAANADTAAYGQIWVKNTTPNQLWFTNDAGADVQLGVAGGGGVPTEIWIRPETYGAVTDDGIDDTAAFVSAIAAAAANGQVVKCSAGVYNFSGHFTLTSGVHIKGVKAGNYFIDTVPNAATDMDGTVFVPSEILADDELTYFINMESNSRISELAIYYEGQYTTNTTPKLYPWTLWSTGDVRGIRINDIAVYRAYKFLYAHGSSFDVDNVYGHIIKYGIWSTKGGDTNRFTDVHFQPVHSYGNQWVSTDMWVWSTSNGARAFYNGIGTGAGGPGNSWDKFTNCFAYGFETVFYVDTGVSGTVLDKCGGDFSKHPFYILGTKTLLSNCQAVAGDRTITGTQTTAYHGFTLGNSSYRAYNVNMNNCEAWVCSGAGVYLRNSENININNQQVISWSLASDGGQWGAVHVSSSATGTNVFATAINGLSTRSPGNDGASSVRCAGSANYMTVNGCALRGDGKTGTYGLRGTPTGAGINYANLFIGCTTNVSGTWTSSP